MKSPTIMIHNSETGEVIEREMNADELAQYQIDVQRDAARVSELEKNASAKQAILDRLGLTADEAKLLLS
jgi:hypothetical protein